MGSGNGWLGRVVGRARKKKSGQQKHSGSVRRPARPPDIGGKHECATHSGAPPAKSQRSAPSLRTARNAAGSSSPHSAERCGAEPRALASAPAATAQRSAASAVGRSAENAAKSRLLQSSSSADSAAIRADSARRGAGLAAAAACRIAAATLAAGASMARSAAGAPASCCASSAKTTAPSSAAHAPSEPRCASSLQGKAAKGREHVSGRPAFRGERRCRALAWQLDKHTGEPAAVGQASSRPQPWQRRQAAAAGRRAGGGGGGA